MYICVSMCGYMHLISDTLRDQKRALDLMEQKLQADISGAIGVLTGLLNGQYMLLTTESFCQP